MKPIATLATMLALAAPASAFAHAHLTAAQPADKAMVSPAPTALSLTFSEGVALKFTGITLTGPDKATVKTGAASVNAGHTELTVPLTGPLAAGAYTVTWHALSDDGHKTHGTYSFTVK